MRDPVGRLGPGSSSISGSFDITGARSNEKDARHTAVNWISEQQFPVCRFPRPSRLLRCSVASSQPSRLGRQPARLATQLNRRYKTGHPFLPTQRTRAFFHQRRPIDLSLLFQSTMPRGVNLPLVPAILIELPVT